SHVLQEVDVFSDQVILIANGAIMAEGQIRNVREEIKEHPSQYLLSCKDAARVASLLFGQVDVNEAKVMEDGSGLLVMTRNRDALARALENIALSGIEIDGVIPADENVDALYEYLIGGGR
ncbi:MAG TPA: ABC transporter ATP-binding protein, partial [Bryobacteraceae bacterium]|nr:ABC transporter ATP-binding protein [Bryobacteraceae bacterium]